VGKRSLSEPALRAQIGLGWEELVRELQVGGPEKLTSKELRTFLKERFALSPWWLTAIGAGLNDRLGLGISNRQRNGLYRQTSQRRFAAASEELFSRFCTAEGFASWVQSDECMAIDVGVELRTADHVFYVTDVDEVGWIRMERSLTGPCSVVHCSFRSMAGKTLVEFAESDLQSPADCHFSSEQWNSVLDRLQLPGSVERFSRRRVPLGSFTKCSGAL
jgi:hypothetical protein